MLSRKKKKQPKLPETEEVRPPRTTTISPREDNRWKGLTPPPDIRTPGTEVITPEMPPPGPFFRPERGPRAIGRRLPPTPNDYNPYPFERVPVAARRSSVQSVRGLVNSPTTPWSREADHGSTLSVPRDRLPETPDSMLPTEGSVISDPALTMTIKGNDGNTPASSRRTFPRKKRNLITAPYSTWTDPGRVRGRRVPRQRPPHTTWSNATVNGSVVAPVWAEQRLVNDPDSLDTSLWVRRHHGQNNDLIKRPLYIANDLETDKDFVVTPEGSRNYITRDIPQTRTGVKEIHSDWIPAGYYEEPAYPRVKQIHRLNHHDSDHMSLPDPHIIEGPPPPVPIHHYRPYSLPSNIGREPRRYPPRTFIPHRDLKPRPPLPAPVPSVDSDEVASVVPARLVELTPDGPRELPKLAPTTIDERSLEPNQGSIRVGRNDSHLEQLRGAFDNERYRQHDYLPRWGYYVETPPSPNQSMKPRQGSVVDHDYKKRPFVCNSGLMTPKSISKSMRAEHGSTITTASEKSERPARNYERPYYGDDDYGDGYRGNQLLARGPETFDQPNPRRGKAIEKKGRYDNRANNRRQKPDKHRRVHIHEEGGDYPVKEDNMVWERRFAKISDDASFPFTFTGFLKIMQMVICILIIILALVDNALWSASIFVACIGIIGFAVALGSFVFRFLGFQTSAVLPCLWFEVILYGVVAICMLAAGILSAISATVSGTVGAVTFFCFLATVVFALDAIIMGQILKQKHRELYPDSDEDDYSDEDVRGDARDPRDRNPRGGPSDVRQGPRYGRREDYDRRMPQYGRNNRGYDDRY